MRKTSSNPLEETCRLPLTSRIHRAIDEFIAGMGLAIQLPERNFRGLEFPGLGSFTLTVLPEAGRTLACFVFKLQSAGEDMEPQLFAVSQTISPDGKMIRPGLADRDEIILAIHIEDDEMSLQMLDQCLRQLLAVRRYFR